MVPEYLLYWFWINLTRSKTVGAHHDIVHIVTEGQRAQTVHLGVDMIPVHIYCKVYIINCLQYKPYCSVYFKKSKLQFEFITTSYTSSQKGRNVHVFCTVYIINCEVCKIKVYIIYCTMYIIYCKVCTVLIMYCNVYSMYYTVYIFNQ